jgi:Putative peptidase family
MAPHFDINVILVGSNEFTTPERALVNAALDNLKAKYASIGLPIGTVVRYGLTAAQVGGLVIPRSDAECRLLSERWGVPNDAMDVFVVRAIATPGPGVHGISPTDGNCNKIDTKRVRTPVISIGEGLDAASVAFMHEIGHCLGLLHCHEYPIACGPDNVMQEKYRRTNLKFTPIQIATMKKHCYVKP